MIPDEGYLLHTSEIANSDKYIDYAISLHSKSTAMRMNVPGMDSYVMDTLMPAMNFLLRSEVLSGISKVTTPWLVCENCLHVYFAKE